MEVNTRQGRKALRDWNELNQTQQEQYAKISQRAQNSGYFLDDINYQVALMFDLIQAQTDQEEAEIDLEIACTWQAFQELSFEQQKIIWEKLSQI